MTLEFVCIAYGNSSQDLDHTRLKKMMMRQPDLANLESTLLNQFEEFFNNKTEISYQSDPTYKLDKEIDIFTLVDPPVLSAVNDVFNMSASLGSFNIMNGTNPKSLVYFFSNDQGDLTYLLFQHYKESLKLFKKTIFSFHEDTFKQVQDAMLIIPDAIIGAYNLQQNILYFNSSYISSTIDLSSIFQEASDLDIMNWGNSNSSFSIPENISSLLTNPYRKRFSSIIHNFSNIRLTSSQILAEAEKFGIELMIDPQNNTKYLLPNTKNKLEECLKFLNGDIFHSDLYGEDFETNSKRKL